MCVRLFHWGKVLGDAPAVLIRNKVHLPFSISCDVTQKDALPTVLWDFFDKERYI